MSTLANAIPDDSVGLWEAVNASDLSKARGHQKRIMECFDTLVQVKTGDFRSACKHILYKRGVFSTSRCSGPLQSLEDEELAHVDQRAKSLGLF